jgi:chemotaxis-related protein WspB
MQQNLQVKRQDADILVLVFYLGETMYLIRHDRAREVSPMVMLNKTPHAPPYFAGFFNYRGTLAPVFDLGQLIQGTPCRLRLSTRIILAEYQPPGETPQVFGLLAERVTDAVKKSAAAFVTPSAGIRAKAYLREFLLENQTMIQCIDLDRLFEQFRGLPLLQAAPGEQDEGQALLPFG